MTKKNSIITQKDILILKQLLEDGRKSSSKISKEIDLGREIVNYRIKRLIKENLIVKFVPKVNEKALHYKEYLIFLKLNLEDELSKEKFAKETIGNKYLVWIIKSESGWDLLVRLYAASLDEFKEKLTEILEGYSDVLANYYTIISSQEIKECEKEMLFEKVFHEHQTKKDFKVIKEAENLVIDTKDKEILRLLEKDARVQYKEIAEKIEVSSDTVKYRIDKMRSQGIIENFKPIINFNKLGFKQCAAILKFKYLNKENEDLIHEYIFKCQFITKAIKGFRAEEFFINLVFKDEKEIEKFKKDVDEKFADKIEQFEVFEID